MNQNKLDSYFMFLDLDKAKQYKYKNKNDKIEKVKIDNETWIRIPCIINKHTLEPHEAFRYKGKALDNFYLSPMYLLDLEPAYTNVFSRYRLKDGDKLLHDNIVDREAQYIALYNDLLIAPEEEREKFIDSIEGYMQLKPESHWEWVDK